MENGQTSTRPTEGRSGKRSRSVCHRCHEKKIRCDLKLLSSSPSNHAPCSACVASETECTFRPSQKGRRRTKPVDTSRLSSNSNKHPSRSLNESRFANGSVASTNPPIIDYDEDADDCGTEPLFDNDTGTSQGAQAIDTIPPTLQQSNVETFFEMGYAWFPIFDPESSSDTSINIRSQLLQHALALFAGRLRPPLRPHATPQEHYRRAKHLFYHSTVEDPLDRIRAAMLIYWCSSSPPDVSSMDGSFWWIGAAIRLAQDIGLHRECKDGNEDSNVKRRIWWTLYSRERLAAICRGRPCIIDEDYCDVRLPTIDDFPQSKLREAGIFTNWVRLSMIMGQVNKQLFTSRRNGVAVPTISIAQQLTEWIDSTHPSIPLPVSKERTAPFDRDVHLLYLPYLTTISLVYLNTHPNRLPQASVPAVIAASCVARVFEDFLARGFWSFITEQSGWFIAIAILSLLHVRSLTFLQLQAMAHIRLLRAALKHVAEIWPSARRLEAGIDRLLGPDASDSQGRASHVNTSSSISTPSQPSTNRSPSFLEELCAGDGVQWARFFPFVTKDTSPLIAIILTECRSSFPELWPDIDCTGQFNELLEHYGSFPLDEAFTISATDWDLQV